MIYLFYLDFSFLQWGKASPVFFLKSQERLFLNQLPSDRPIIYSLTHIFIEKRHLNSVNILFEGWILLDYLSYLIDFPLAKLYHQKFHLVKSYWTIWFAFFYLDSSFLRLSKASPVPVCFFKSQEVRYEFNEYPLVRGITSDIT